MPERSPAICLRTIDYSETSQVVWLLTRDRGLVRVLAKGTKRPKSKSGGAIDLTSEGDLVFVLKSGTPLGTLIEFTEAVPHTGLRRRSVSLYAAVYMLELAASLLGESDPHPEVFELLHNGLARLDQADAPVPAVLAYFQWRLLKHVGLAAQTRQCVSCGRGIPAPEEAWFSSQAGGILCRHCHPQQLEKIRLDAPTRAGLAVLAQAQAGKKVALDADQAEGVNRLLAYHIQSQLGRPLKSLPHVVTRPQAG